MRIYVIFTDEPVFHPRILYQLVLGRPSEIVGVSGVGHRPKRQSWWRYLKSQLRFWGLRGTGHNFLVVTAHRILDQEPFSSTLVGYHSLAAVCREFDIPYRLVDRVNEPAYLEFLRALDIDVIISSQGQIFKKALLELPHLGCINRHSALLPAYGGLKPVFWAMLHGESETGVTVHRMTEGIDDGAILAQSRVPVKLGRTLYNLYRDLFELSGPTILRSLEIIEKRRPADSRDPSLEPSYYRDPTSADIAQFRRRALSMV